MADTEQEKPGSWKELLYDFTQDTTLHGVRFTTRATPYVLRRILWILAVLTCLSIFSWFCYNQFILLISNEIGVTVEVLFSSSVVFPTVTICNQNFFKRSRAQIYGQHDIIVEGFRTTKSQNSTDEQMETVKDFDREANTILTGLSQYEIQYRNVTVEVCKLACISVVDDTCCSLLYNRRTQTCIITALEPSMPDIDKKPDTEEVTDYYRRQSCNIKREAQCAFDSENTCNFQIDRSTTLAWKIVDGTGQGTNIKSDHTKMSKSGFFLYASRNRQNARARLLSPYFSANNTCLEFFHQIRNGKLKVYQGLRDDSKIVWKRGKTISTDWERGYMALPDGYIRVTIDAVADEGRVDIGLDDVKISKCKPIKECRETALGLGYRGTISHTQLRKTCKNWDMVPEYTRPLTWNFESLNISHEQNFCRNPDNDPLGLWCITNIETMEMDYCDVPFCECREKEEFTCGNGRCIPMEKRCDTNFNSVINDCGDLSDEFKCENKKMSVNCTFENWNCTYSSPPDSIRKWEFTEKRDGKWMSVPTRNKGRMGDFAVLQSPTFQLNQSACMLLRYNLSETDTIDLFYLEGPTTFYREHICTLQGINHTYYEAGLDPDAPLGYKFSIDIPAEATNLMFIASSRNDTLSDVRIYNVTIANMNCSDYFAPPTEAPTTVMTLNFTADNDSLWWNATTEAVSSRRSEVTTEGDSFDMTTNATTLAPEVTTMYLPVYNPECVGNFTGECVSCLKDAFFWTRDPNITNIRIVYLTGGASSTTSSPPQNCKDNDPSYCAAVELEDFCPPDGRFGGSREGIFIQKNCKLSCGMCGPETIIECFEPQGIECSFYDECICGYKFTSSNENWVWKQEPMSNFTAADDAVAIAPHADDNYLRVHNLSESSVKGDWIRLYSPIEDFENTSCLNFLYFSRYMDVKVFAYNETYTQLLLAITFDGQERHWHPASTNIQPGRHGVIFELTYSQFAYKNAGIDNVTIVPGLCESGSSNPSINCTFESNDWCGYMDVSAGPRNWYRTLGTSGNYFLRTRSINQGKVSRILKSPRFNLTQDSCMTFDFFDSAGDASDTTEIRTFSISQQTFRGTSRRPSENQTIWRVFGTMKDENWHRAQANISAGEHYLLLEVNGDNYRVGIKNITVTPGLCPEFNCSTESLADGLSSEWQACNNSFFLCLGPEALDDQVANCDDGEDVTKPRHKDDDKYFITTQDGELPPSTPNVNLPDPVVGLEDLYRKVGHQGEDLIYKCEWDGNPCDYRNFTTRITDYGLCYMFNVNQTTAETTGKRVPLESNRTGARFGLRLTLNIEEYEYMSGPNTDAGIKMFLHAADEEPQVRDLGFAISPGLHALVGIQRNTAINLKDPWGECDDSKELDFFDKYTQSACEVEIETFDLVDACDCRDAYMPGASAAEPAVCEVDQYFSCAVPHLTHIAATINGNKTSDPKKDRICPQPCNQTVYEPSLSYALLSTLSVDQILNREDFDLQGKYRVALETVQRVNPDIFTSDMKKLLDLERAYKEMRRYVSEFLAAGDDASDALAVDDTIAIKLLQTVAEMRKITIDDCRKVLGDLIGYKNAFEEKFRPNIDLLELYNGNLQTTYKQVKQLLDLSVRQEEVSSYLERMAEGARMWTELARATVDVLDNDMVQNGPSNQNGEKHPEQYFRDDRVNECRDAFRSVKTSMDTLINVYARIAETSTDRNSWRSLRGEPDFLEANMTDYEDKYKKTTGCINEYSSILDRIVEWLDTNTLEAVQKKNTEELKKQEETIRNFENNRKDLNRDLRLVTLNSFQYALAETEKLNFLKAITDPVEGITLLSKIEIFQKRVQAETVEPLRDMIKEAKRDLEVLYNDALDFAVEMDNYLKDGYFYLLVTGMSIWKMPLPNMEEPPNPYYYRETIELWKIWDLNMPLTEFVRCTAPTDEQGQNCGDDVQGEAIRKIKNALERQADSQTGEPAGYFTDVETEIAQFENDITASKQKITDQITELNTVKSEFEKKKTIDETFIGDNFMKVDVYFKQLKYQRVEQTKAYQLLDFLSDVGGYLGLLLGASALTLCEIIDLIVYNGIKKTLSSSNESNFTADPEANGKAVPPTDSDKIPTMNELDEAPDGMTNYGMTDDRGFTSAEFNKA